jgi:hypothetical protein
MVGFAHLSVGFYGGYNIEVLSPFCTFPDSGGFIVIPQKIKQIKPGWYGGCFPMSRYPMILIFFWDATMWCPIDSSK